MAVQQISERQVADLVTSLARGRTVAQTATRLRMAESIVDEIGRLNGYPNTVELNQNSRILNRRLRNKTPAEDLDTDVPVTDVVSAESDTESDAATPVADSASSSEVPEPEVEEPDVVLWRCVRRGCGYDLRGPKSADEADVQRAIELHKQTHLDEGTVAIPGPVHVGHPAGERRLQDCAACRAEAVEPPVIVPGEVVPDESIADAVDRLIAEGLVEVVDADTALMQIAHVPNGSTVPEALGEILVSMGGQLAATPDSPGAPSPGEAVPDAADVATSEQHGVQGVEEPPVAPQPGPDPAVGWLAAGPRTIERLLEEASRTGHGPIVEQAVRIRGDLQLLADRLDRWVDLADQRKAILHELDILGRRQDELTEKLARLDADDETIRPEVIRTPTLLADANDLAAAILEDKAAEAPRSGFEVFPKPKGKGFADRSALWFQLPTEVRAEVKTWCENNRVEHASTGRQPKAAVEAYLAAHPEHDPRLNTPEEN